MLKLTSYIAYYRVSTQKQGRSGLGLEAQLADVAHLAEQRGGVVIASYKEVEANSTTTKATWCRRSPNKPG